MLKYWISRHGSRGEVLSIDKLTLKGELSHSFFDTFFMEFSRFVFDSSRNAMIIKDNCRIGEAVNQYRYNYNFKLVNHSSCFFACQHNSQKKDKISWKFEFNPNKCLPDSFIDCLLSFVVARSSVVSIAQMDLAIDFYAPRTNFYFDKDRRISTEKVYETVNDGFGNTTEYLSKHNEHGFCKLYNKSVESNLDFALTRFEITLKEYSVGAVTSAMPDLHIFDKRQLSFDDLSKLEKLTQNDCVLLEMACKYPDLYQKLTYRKRQKLAPYVMAFAPVYEIDYKIFNSLYDELVERLKLQWMIYNV